MYYGVGVEVSALATGDATALRELLAKPIPPDDTDRRLRLLGQTVGAITARHPRRRDLMDAIAALEAHLEHQAAESRSTAEGGRLSDTLRVLAAVLRGYHAAEVADRKNAETPSSPTVRARVLLTLLSGPLGSSDVAKEAATPQTVASRTLTSLRDAGLVAYTTGSDVGDKRRRVYEITDAGRSELERLGVRAGPSQTGDWPDDRPRPTPQIVTAPAPSTAPPLVRLARKTRRQGRASADHIRALVESLADPMPGRARAETLAELVVSARYEIRPLSHTDAATYLDDLLALGSSSDDPAIEARAQYELARLVMLGIPHPAALGADTPLTIAEKHASEAQDTELIGWCTYTRALLCRESADFKKAAQYATHAADAFERGGHSFGQTSSMLLLGRVLLADGEPAAAKKALKAAVRLAHRHHHDAEEGAASLALGEAELLDDPTAASNRLQRAAAVYTELDDHVQGAVAQGALGIAAFLSHKKGGPATALAVLEELRDSLDVLQQSGNIWGRALTGRRLGVLAREAGDLEQAVVFLSDAAKGYGRLGDPLGEAATLGSLLITLKKANRPEDAQQQFGRLVRLLKRTSAAAERDRYLSTTTWRWCINVARHTASDITPPRSTHAEFLALLALAKSQPTASDARKVKPPIAVELLDVRQLP